MNTFRIHVIGYVALAALLWAPFAMAQSPKPPAKERSNWVDLRGESSTRGYINMLDRGSVNGSMATARKTHASPMATIMPPGAGTGVTMVSIGFFPTVVTGVGFVGNFFSAPADFPTSYYPFFITGAYAFGTGPPTMLTLGAGVATGPFPVGTMMWAGFATAMLAGPPGMTSGLFGGPGIFPHSPATLGVATGQGCACGLLSTPGSGPGVGALAFPSTPRASRVEFTGPPSNTMESLVTATFVLPNVVVAGCFVSGATVPVELQNFSIE